MNINEALAARVPLPWKQSTCDGPPQWKVERQRPEDFTAEIYKRLREYKMKEDDIRQLFCIRNDDYTAIKQRAGIESAKTGLVNWLADIAPKDRPKVVVDPPHAPTAPELEDVFRPADRPLTIRDCAARLLAAIDAREKADKEIAYYGAEIRRMA